MVVCRAIRTIIHRWKIRLETDYDVSEYVPLVHRLFFFFFLKNNLPNIISVTKHLSDLRELYTPNMFVFDSK